MKDEEYFRTSEDSSLEVYCFINDHRGTQKPKSRSSIRFEKTVKMLTPEDLTF
jgi:hypothetical protein